MSTIWFIRHAESETNVGLPTLNPLTIQLTKQGFKQAQQIANTIEKCPDLIITSPYVRSKQTAIPILERFPHTRYEEWPVHEFTYLVQSIGRKTTTIEQRRFLVNAYWERLDPYYRDGKGAESFVDFMNRVRGILEKLKNYNEQFIVVFTHGQFMLAALSWLMGLILEDMQQFRHFTLAHKIPNGAILKISLQKGNEFQFSPFNTSHLSAISKSVFGQPLTKRVLV